MRHTGASFVWGGAAVVAEMLVLIGGMEKSTPIGTVRSYSFRSGMFEMTFFQ